MNQPIGQLRVRCGDAFSNTFWCDRLAVGRGSGSHRPLHAFSVIGPQIQVKALAAALLSDSYVQFESFDVPLVSEGRTDSSMLYLYDLKEGWKVHRLKHPQNQAQLVAVAQVDGMLLEMSEESLWRELASERYTTPLLRSWMPAITEELLSRKLLAPLVTCNCQCGMLNLEPEKLDELVSELVQNKRLIIN